MSKWIISKEFSCDYGHRVWTQKLDNELSCNASCVCRHLHGHRATILVHLESDELNPEGMVVDFVNLNWFKKFLDDTIDHKMILDVNDPIIHTILPDYFPAEVVDSQKDEYLETVTVLHDDGYRTLKNWDTLEDPHLRELYEGIILVHFVPTSENLSRWLHEIVQKRMSKLDVTVQRIQFYETPKSQSNYII